jgi:dolichyl-phosphate-mannose-protein mannosyltransferase
MALAKLKIDRKILALCLTAFLFRLALSPHLTYERDLNCWVGWSDWIIERGFKRFYEGWSDYLPGYLYVLWFLGKIRQVLEGLNFSVNLYVLYKLPAILADVAMVYLIYSLVKKWANKNLALLASLVYAFNPAVFANSTLWGHIDSLNTLFYLLTLITLIKGKVILSSVFLAISCLIKPQGLVLVPLTVLILLKKKNLKLTIFYCSSFIALFLLAFVPFFNFQFTHFAGFLRNAIFNFQFFQFILSRYQVSLGQYQYTSLNAFNFWAVNKMWWKADSLKFLLLPCQFWGLIVFGMIYGGCLWLLWKRYKLSSKEKFSIFNFQFSISLLAVIFSALFLFPTRVHERHLFSVFPFLVLAATIIPRLWWIYGWYSLSYFLNLAFAYVWLTADFREIFSPQVVSTLSLLNLVVFAFSLKSVLAFSGFGKREQAVTFSVHDRILRRLHFKAKRAKKAKKAEKKKLFDISLSDRVKKALCGLLILVALFTRFFRLSIPQKFMFDEVYHGFTAIEFAKGNQKAWEWWNTPPEGVAYEWTHPPLAKLLMAQGILIFSEDSFGWRVASATMGVVAIVFIFLLAQALFGNFFISLVSAFLMTFDFLPFVLSRIAMNDIFFLAFQLGSFYFFVKWLKQEKLQASSYQLLLAGLLWGCALSSKWSAIYAVFVFTPFLLWKLKTLIISNQSLVINFLIYCLSFVVLPIVVYLTSYSPFFLQGHDFKTFINLQKQMWWYHTGLKATHPFTSPWWSWLLDIRPVWFYVDYGKDTIANVYCFGNPLIWWTGLFAVLYLSHRLLRNFQFSIFNFQLLFVFLGYFGFWLPWVRAPRIMFIYHYLPSLPFLYMALAYGLNKIFFSKSQVSLSPIPRKGAWPPRGFTPYSLNPKKFVIGYLLLVVLLFAFFYPHLAAFPVPKDFSKFYFWFGSWK